MTLVVRFVTSLSVLREYCSREEKTLADEYRASVARLRRQYSTRYAAQIAHALADAPPWTAGQLAHLRRVLQARRPR